MNTIENMAGFLHQAIPSVSSPDCVPRAMAYSRPSDLLSALDAELPRMISERAIARSSIPASLTTPLVDLGKASWVDEIIPGEPIAYAGNAIPVHIFAGMPPEQHLRYLHVLVRATLATMLQGSPESRHFASSAHGRTLVAACVAARVGFYAAFRVLPHQLNTAPLPQLSWNRDRGRVLPVGYPLANTPWKEAFVEVPEMEQWAWQLALEVVVVSPLIGRMAACELVSPVNAIALSELERLLVVSWSGRTLLRSDQSALFHAPASKAAMMMATLSGLGRGIANVLVMDPWVATRVLRRVTWWPAARNALAARERALWESPDRRPHWGTSVSAYDDHWAEDAQAEMEEAGMMQREGPAWDAEDTANDTEIGSGDDWADDFESSHNIISAGE
jgi:hypothetical protein